MTVSPDVDTKMSHRLDVDKKSKDDNFSAAVKVRLSNIDYGSKRSISELKRSSRNVDNSPKSILMNSQSNGKELELNQDL